MNQPRRQNGQAMTEFLISAAFVLVPLFLIVPAIGKYIDMKHAAIASSRYVTWEYTAHYARAGDGSSGFRALSRSQRPVKSLRETAREAERRTYANSRLPLDSHADRAGIAQSEVRPLWRYHDGSPMFRTASGRTVSPVGPDRTPDRTGIFNGVLHAVAELARLLSGALQAVGVDAGFDAINERGRFGVAVALPVENAPGWTPIHHADPAPLFLQDLNLTLAARGALLTDGWAAGGMQHANRQSRGLVAGALLKPILNDWIPIQSLASTILLSPELGPENLQFGILPTDQVPPGKLRSDTRSVNCPGGYCEY